MRFNILAIKLIRLFIKIFLQIFISDYSENSDVLLENKLTMLLISILNKSYKSC